VYGVNKPNKRHEICIFVCEGYLVISTVRKLSTGYNAPILGNMTLYT